MQAQGSRTRLSLIAATAAALAWATGAGAATCGGPDHQTCGAHQYCRLDLGQCGQPNPTGTCAPRPTFCLGGSLRTDGPVCACGGQTYPSVCNAEMAGRTVRYRGKCAPPTPIRPGPMIAHPQY